MPDDQAQLVVGGIAIEFWKTVEITKSLFSLAGSFVFSSSDDFTDHPELWRIKNGSECQIRVNGDTLMTGYIDQIQAGYSAEGHEIVFSGREKTADLIDCSIETNVELKNQAVRTIISKICAPFGISVTVDTHSDLTRLNKLYETFELTTGENCFEVIAGLCRDNGILPLTNAKGHLVLSGPGRLPTFVPLQSGEPMGNILSAKLVDSDIQRFSRYIAKGTANNGDFRTITEASSPASSVVTDSVMARYRPLVIFADNILDVGTANVRANFEKNIRAGRSRQIEVSVQGWTQKISLETEGVLWELNRTIKMDDPTLGIDGRYLIAELQFMQSPQAGTVTKMTLVHPDTFKTLRAETIRSRFDTNRDFSQNLP